MRNTQMWAIARAVVDAVDCRRCGRPRGQKCRNLRIAHWRPEQDIHLPHKERYGDAPVCCGMAYFCLTSGELRCKTHDGFDVCCGNRLCPGVVRVEIAEMYDVPEEML